MAIFEKIRNKVGNTFIVAAIICLIVLFVGSDIVGGFWSYVWGAGKNPQTGRAGSVAGEKLSYGDYRAAYTRNYRHKLLQLQAQDKSLTAEIEMEIKNKAWNEMVARQLYSYEIKKVGIAVGADELVDLVQGDHIRPVIKQAPFLKNPETGSFDKQKLLDYLNSIRQSKSKEELEAWQETENQFRMQRAVEKLNKLMKQSCFVTSLEKEQAKKRENRLCDVDYLYIPFESVSNDAITVCNQQLLDYMVAHKPHYKTSEHRTVHYITFPIQPDEKDKNNADFKKELNDLSLQFAAAADPYAFAKQYTDGALTAVSLRCAVDQLPDALAKVKDTLQKEMVVGPEVKGGFCVFYKIVAIPSGAGEDYQIAVLEKKIHAGSRVRSDCYKKAQQFATRVGGLADFKERAQNDNLMVQEQQIAPADWTIGNYRSAREVVRWLYNEARVGKVAKVFDLGDVYMVAILAERVPAGGLLPLQLVAQEVYTKVSNQKKAELIEDRIKRSIGEQGFNKQPAAATLQELATVYGDPAVVVRSVKGLCFSKTSDYKEKELKRAKFFVGRCFGLQSGVISDPIRDEEGIFVAYIKDRYDKGEEENSDVKKESLPDLEALLSGFYVSQSMQELANIVDERYKFE